MKTIDYRKLLKKYMNLVGHEEGITFANRASEEDFSEEERRELIVIEDEVCGTEYEKQTQ
jgi:hypothetical protein